MSNLIGKYQDQNKDVTLCITEADDGNGRLSGTMTSSGVNFNVNGHYHFYRNDGGETNILVNGRHEPTSAKEIVYEALAGFALDGSFDKLIFLGGRAVVSLGMLAPPTQVPEIILLRQP